MKKMLLFALLAAIATSAVNSQNNIIFQNPSFEGTLQVNIVPPGWFACSGNTPDIQPGNFNIILAPSNGNSYIGLCDQPSTNWQESVSQTLANNLIAGQSYTFSIDLATTNSTAGGITPGPIELQIWASMGGNSGCDQTELCWSSGVITNTVWQTYVVSFTPTANYTSLAFAAHNLGVVVCPYILVDNILNMNQDSVFAQSNPSTCYNTCDGSMSVIAVGGTPPYQYLWSPGGATTSAVSNVCMGTYTVQITDSQSHVYHDTISVSSGIGPSAIIPPELCIVTVDTAIGKNLVVWEKPISTTIDSFVVYRETSMTGNYVPIGTTGYNDFSTFLDMTSNPAQQANRYKIGVRDTCGRYSTKSNFHKTIHLTISAGMGGTWNLNWDKYSGFTYNTFNIYRGTTPSNMTLIANVAGNLYSFTDLTPPIGYLYYAVTVNSPTICNPSKTINSINSSMSNLVNTQTIGINENYELNQIISLYPNPPANNLTIESKQKGIIKILNMQGQVIKSLAASGTKTNVDISDLPSGIYMVQLKTEKGVGVRKFVKE